MEKLAQEFGKGAIETPQIVKDTHYQLMAAPIPPVNWAKTRRDRWLPILNQRQTLSCTAHAAVYYGRVLNKIRNGIDEEYGSRRHIYSQVYAPEGGAYIWKAMSIPVKQGFISELSVPEGDYSELTLRDSSLNPNAIVEALPEKYAQLTNNKNMDYLAWVIDTFGGFVTGFNGNNNMFLPGGITTIPQSVDWGHSVYVYDYGLLPNGEKTLIYVNSWDGWGDAGYGYFPENFCKSGYLFDAYTYASIKDIDPNSMFNLFQVAGDEEVWLVRDVKQADGAFLKMKTHVYNAGALTTISDFANIKPITKAELDAISDTGLDLATLIKK